VPQWRAPVYTDGCTHDFVFQETAGLDAGVRLRIASRHRLLTTATAMSHHHVRVLIADDHASFRDVARVLLERRGFAVVGEATGAAACLEAAERLAPQAVLLDVRLGDGDGFEVCRALTRDDPRRAVLLVSADDRREAPARAHDCGARGFVLKSLLATADLVTLLAPAH
jgi:CheY-like chemotaxis protein